MNVLITGGGGFLGKNLQNHLSGDNYFYPRSSKLNLLHFDSVVMYLLKNKIDSILHMAASCGGILANKNAPADFLRDNTQMGLNIYEAARQVGTVKTIYSLGSVCSYPVNCPTPFREDDIWNGPAESTNFPYGQAKRTLMMLSQTYRDQYGIQGGHLIPVNMYGAHDHFDLVNSHVIPALIRKFVTATEENLATVECWGTGAATREFLFANDCAGALAQVVQSQPDLPAPINLGVGQDISIRDLAYKIKSLTGFKGDVVFTGEVSDGQPKRVLDVSRAKRTLNWTAATSLDQGLRQTIDWYMKYRPTT